MTISCIAAVHSRPVRDISKRRAMYIEDTPRTERDEPSRVFVHCLRRRDHLYAHCRG